MKRKRDVALIGDLVLTDARGRSIRVDKGLLVDRSDYFANLLGQTSLDVIQLDETYLIELIHYLYRQESDENHDENDSATYDVGVNLNSSASITQAPHRAHENLGQVMTSYDDIDILMHLLVLSQKYGFKELYKDLVCEINYNLQPATVICAFNSALKLGLSELVKSTKLMILSWLPQLHNSEQFLCLPEQSIELIFNSEPPEVDNEWKLSSLSAWWSRNKQADMTHLWKALVTSQNK